MPINSDNTLILREPLSGHGANLLLSKGAEEFDPNSMVEEVAPADTAPIKSLPRPTLLSMKIVDKASLEPFEVGGLLQAVVSTKDSLFFKFTCLLAVAIELSSMAFRPDPAFLVLAEAKAKDAENSWEGLERMILTNATIGDFVGDTATVTVQFIRAEEAG